MHTDRTPLTRDELLTRRRALAMLAMGAGAAVLVACGGSATDTPRPATAALATVAPATAASASATSATSATVATGQGDPPLLAIDAVEYGFRTPTGSVPAGMTMVRMRNLGQEDHQAQILRLNDGVTPAQVQATFGADPLAVTQLTTLVGGPGTIAAGGTSAALLDLRPGQYLLVCFIPGRDGVAHAAKGMVLPLAVTARTGDASPAPATQGTVTMREFSFALSAGILPAGRSMVTVINEGAQAHEFGLLRLAPGKTAAEVTGYFVGKSAGPPPFSAAGGMAALSSGQRGIAALDLTPGAYAAICFLPDPASGKQHLQLGMIADITVE